MEQEFQNWNSHFYLPRLSMPGIAYRLESVEFIESSQEQLYLATFVSTDSTSYQMTMLDDSRWRVLEIIEMRGL